MIDYVEIKDMTDGGVAMETDYLAAQRGAEAKRLSLAQLRQHINLRNYEPALLYLSGAATLYNGQLYHANKNTQGTFKPADWDEARTHRIGGGVARKVKAGVRVVVSSGFIMEWSYDLPLEIEAGGILEIEPEGYVIPPAGGTIVNNGTIINNGTINTQGGGMEGAGEYGGLGDLF